MDGRNHLAEHPAPCIDDTKHRAAGLVSGSEVVVTVTVVEPDLVVAGYPCDLGPDLTRRRFHDDRDGRCSLGSRFRQWIREAPHHAVRVERDAATHKQFLVRTDCETG